MDEAEHEGGVDGVDFEALADAVGEGDGEAATEVFAEVFKALEGVGIEVGRADGEIARLERVEDALRFVLCEQALFLCVTGVEGDADGDGLAVAEGVAGLDLELVRGPVAEVERARGAELKGVAACADVFKVELGATADDLFDGSLVALP